MARRKTAKVLETLVFYDTPQVVLLGIDDNRYAISVAIDSEVGELRFLAAEIDKQQWDRYLREKHDLRFLFDHPKWKNWYLFDLTKAANELVDLWPALERVYKDNKNLPEKGFFARHHTSQIQTEISIGFAEKIYLIDGVWDLIDFAQLNARISDLYAFMHSFIKYNSKDTSIEQKRKIKEAYIFPALRDGSSYVNLFRDLANAQSFSEKLRIKSIQYASPGHVRVEGREEILEHIDFVLLNFSQNYEEIKNHYNELYRFLQRNKLLKRDKEKFDQDSAITDYFFHSARKLGNKVGIRDVETLYEMVDRNKLSFAKVVLAHFRRVHRYYQFFAEGRVKNG